MAFLVILPNEKSLGTCDRLPVNRLFGVEDRDGRPVALGIGCPEDVVDTNNTATSNVFDPKDLVWSDGITRMISYNFTGNFTGYQQKCPGGTLASGIRRYSSAGSGLEAFGLVCSNVPFDVHVEDNILLEWNATGSDPDSSIRYRVGEGIVRVERLDLLPLSAVRLSLRIEGSGASASIIDSAGHSIKSFSYGQLRSGDVWLSFGKAEKYTESGDIPLTLKVSMRTALVGHRVDLQSRITLRIIRDSETKQPFPIALVLGLSLGAVTTIVFSISLVLYRRRRRANPTLVFKRDTSKGTMLTGSNRQLVKETMARSMSRIGTSEKSEWTAQSGVSMQSANSAQTVRSVSNNLFDPLNYTTPASPTTDSMENGTQGHTTSGSVTATFNSSTAGALFYLPGYLKMEPSDLLLGRVIGRGGSGYVQLARLKNEELLQRNADKIGSQGDVVIKHYHDESEGGSNANAERKVDGQGAGNAIGNDQQPQEPPPTPKQQQRGARDQTHEFRFEVAILSMLRAHSCSNMVRIVGFIESPKGIVMQRYVCSLWSVIMDRVGWPELPTEQIKRWALDISSGLADIHRFG